MKKCKAWAIIGPGGGIITFGKSDLAVYDTKHRAEYKIPYIGYKVIQVIICGAKRPTKERK